MDERVEGLRALTVRLNELGRRTGTRTLKRALRKAATPTLRQMRAAAPLGSQPHRTHKGRLVAPGFLKKSIRAITVTDRRQGTAAVVFGVRREAFYGLQFIDDNPTPNAPIAKRRHGKRRGGTRAIRSYTLRQSPFFYRIFVANAGAMTRSFVDTLRTEIERAARGR